MWQFNRGAIAGRGALAAGGAGGGGATNQWNAADKHSSITLSGSPALTATATDSGNFNTVRAVSSASSGKIYWEITLNSDPGGPSCLVGFADSTFNLAATLLGSDGTAMSYEPDNGTLRFNGYFGVAVQGGAITTDTIAIAVDFTARKFWVALITGGGTPTITNGWNNDTLANQNPVTGAGGFNTQFAPLFVGPYFAAANLKLVTGTAVTANFGQSAYRIVSASGAAGGSVPTGYGNWP